MPYTVAWEEAVPAGTAQARDIDLFIQNDKIAVRERMQDMFNVDLRTVTTSDTVYVNELRLGPVNTLRARIQAPSTDTIELRNAAGTGRAQLNARNINVDVVATGLIAVAMTGNAGQFVRNSYVVGAKAWEIGYRSGVTSFTIWEDSINRLTIADTTGQVTVFPQALAGSTLPSTISTIRGLRISGDISNISLNGITYQSGGGGGAAIAFYRDASFGTGIIFGTNPLGGASEGVIERARITPDGVYQVGLGSGTPGIIVDGGNSGLNGGSYILSRSGSLSIIGIGNQSALLGGAYNATPLLFYSGDLTFYASSVTRAILFSTGEFRTFQYDAPNNADRSVMRFEAGTDATLGPLYLQISLRPSATATSRVVKIFAGDSSAFRPIQFDSAGGVIIGTTDPGGNALLRIGGSVRAGTTLAGATLDLYASSYGNNGLLQAFGTDGNLKLQIGGLGNTIAFVYAHTGVSLALYAGAVERVRIVESGSVIIGTDPGGTNILRVGGSITTSGNYRAGFGSIGHSELTAGTTSFSGFIQFSGPNGTRIGYIGFGANAATADAGTIPYVAGIHAFSGSIVIGTDPGGSDPLRVGGNIYSNATVRANQYNDTNNNRLLTTRITGWANPSGISSRATFDPSTVTLSQLGERVSAVIRDLLSHGLIST